MSKPANVVCDPVTGVCKYVDDVPESALETTAAEELSPLIKLLGPTVSSKTGTVPVSSLSGPNKVLGLYFSAHWCGPCRMFTPILAKFYQQFKETHARKDDMEMLFVSSDRDAAAFDSYYAEMPWLALPYEDRTRKAALSKKFKVQGIPTLVFINAETGELITSAGREKVMSDSTGEKFPWVPRSFSEIMAGDLVSAGGKTVPSSEALKGKTILLYFSAHWCPPCRAFTPQLVSTYNKLKEAGKNVEVVFVSGDHDNEQFEEYLGSMPWLAIPYKNEDVKDELNALFEVEGIPSLVVLQEDGTVITTNGRAAVAGDPEGAEFPWLPKPLEALTTNNVSNVNDAAMLLLAGPGDMKARGEALLRSLAEAHKATPRGSELNFTYGSLDEEVVNMVLAFAGVKEPEKDKDTLLLLNIPEQCKYVFDGPEVTKEAVADIVERFLNDNLSTTELGPQ